MNLFKGILVGLLVVASQQAAALTINFDYTYDTNNFFNVNARNTLNAAGSFFGIRITDNLTAINSSGSNHFNAIFNSPGTGNSTTVSDFSVAAATITVYVGGSALTGSTLGQGGPGGYGVNTYSSSFYNNAQTRGQSGVNATPATDFSLWGGAITFNTTTNWYFDKNVSTSADLGTNQIDFYSVALHELGHVLGIGTAASWSNKISNGLFTGTNAVATYGANVPVNTGADHWASGTMSLANGVSQEAAMTPSIAPGQRKVFTNLDVAALKDVGWQIQAVPIPAAIWLFASGLFGLLAVSRRKA